MTENHPVTLPPLSISTLAKIHKVEGYLIDRKSTRLNSSHLVISYAVFCLKKKKKFFVRRLAAAAIQPHCVVGFRARHRRTRSGEQRDRVCVALEVVSHAVHCRVAHVVVLF